MTVVKYSTLSKCVLVISSYLVLFKVQLTEDIFSSDLMMHSVYYLLCYPVKLALLGNTIPPWTSCLTGKRDLRCSWMKLSSVWKSFTPRTECPRQRLTWHSWRNSEINCKCFLKRYISLKKTNTNFISILSLSLDWARKFGQRGCLVIWRHIMIASSWRHRFRNSFAVSDGPILIGKSFGISVRIGPDWQLSPRNNNNKI